MIDALDSVSVAQLSESRALFELGLIIVLAAAAPLLAQVLRMPSILALLGLGFAAGASGALDPDALLGEDLISAIVSIAVGIILFDSGLDLDLRELRGDVGRVYRRLVSIGILITWAAGTFAAYLLFDLSWGVALVLGAVLVVSGPTVVTPLLEYIRPSRRVNTVLKWEGTLADPIGATLGVLVFQAVVAGQAKPGRELVEFALSLGAGVGFGVAGAALALLWAHWFQPNQSQAVTGTLMIVVAMVVGADLARDDAGLITGLLIGAVLVNRPPRGVEPRGLAIQSAKLARAWRGRIATLSTFLIGALFIILSARVLPADVNDVGWMGLAFIAVLVLLVRPVAVAVSTLGSELRARERAFIAWMAPRGIVAAATSSTFALGLDQAGVGDGTGRLIPVTFGVIVATAVIYGLSGPPAARALGVSGAEGGGVLLIGADEVGRAIGRALRDSGLKAVVWSGDEEDLQAAAAEGLALYEGDPTEDAAAAAPSELEGLDYALAVDEDEALNAMVATDLSEYFGRDRVFQLPVPDQAASLYTRAPQLFDASATHEELGSRIRAGGEIRAVEAPAAQEGEAEAADLLGAGGIPMFVHAPGAGLRVLTAGERPSLEAGQELIGLVAPG